MLVVAALGVVVLAGLVLTGEPLSPEPSATAPAIGLASDQPPTTKAPPSARTAAPRPSISPTPGPTAVPPWAWARSELLPGAGVLPLNAWGVGARVLALADSNGRWTFATLEPGRSWQEVPAPRAIDMFGGGVVVDDRLWFMASVTGVAAKDATWQLVSTRDAATWDSQGPANDFGPADGVALLGRVAGSWVVLVWRYIDGAGEGAGEYLLRWSRDGISWADADLPDLPADTTFGRAGTMSGTMFVLGQADGPNTAEHVLLASNDGRTWRRTGIPGTLDWPYDLACNERICALTGFRFESLDVPLAWLTTDGNQWTEASTKLPTDVGHDGINRLVPTESGFLGLAEDRLAWLSTNDGANWRMLEVIPADWERALVGLAVAGDVVIAFDAEPGREPIGVWRGSLSRMSGPTR